MIGANSVVSVQRYKRTGGKEELIAHLSGLECYMEQIAPEKAQALDGNATYKTFSMHFGEVFDIQESDQITDDLGRKYTVKGAQHFEGNQDIEDHSEILALRNHAQAQA